MTTGQSTQEPFLSRKSIFGFRGKRLHNYFAIILVITFLLPFISRGARKAIEGNNNDVRDWLPPNYPESTELKWFQKHFVGEQFALVSWDGCTLGNTQKLDLLGEKLVPRKRSDRQSETHHLFKSVLTGPQVLKQLTSPPLSLDYEDAIRRLEGALVGPLPEGKTNDARTTCLIVTLSAEGSYSNRRKRQALEAISQAAAHCKIPLEGKGKIRMGGPPVDNVAIDIAGEETLIRLAVLSGLVGLVLSYLCFRSYRITSMVFAVGVLSAGISLAMVFYFSIFEVYILGLDRPHFGAVDAILMSMPAVVYVLGLSGAIHIVNYYRDARLEQGIRGAAETALRHGWVPCTLAALTTAVGLGSLFTSDIMPIRKFGTFSALGVLGTLALLFTLLPACLHRFPPVEKVHKSKGRRKNQVSNHPFFTTLMHRVAHFIIRRNVLVASVCVLVMGFFAIGLTKIETRVQLLKLFDKDAQIIHDYAWFEQHLGNLVPMEIVLAIPANHQRMTNEDAEADGEYYKLNMFERLKLVERVQKRIEALPEVDRALSAATFAPALDITKSGPSGWLLDPRNVVSRQLEKHRGELLQGDYLRMELTSVGNRQRKAIRSGRELMRISVRLPALQDIDYGEFVQHIRHIVDPLLSVYRQRDKILEALHTAEHRLRLSKVVLVYDDRLLESAGENSGVDMKLLHRLLRNAGARVTTYDLAKIPSEADSEKTYTQIASALGKMDCVVALTPTGKLDLENISREHSVVVQLASSSWSLDSPAIDSDTADVVAVYTGVIPLVYKTQRELLISLRKSMAWACGLIAFVMVVVFRSLPAGVLTMIPNIFPIVLVFGALGWLGVKVDIGIMMCASVALGVAVDDTVHFLTWFRDGIKQGKDNQEATMLAFERCATAMFQTTVIGGLGLSVFAVSSFTPTQQFGLLMVTLLSTALIGDLIFLPALLSGSLGRFFSGGLKASVASEMAETLPLAGDSPIVTFGPSNSPHGKTRRDQPHRSMRA